MDASKIAPAAQVCSMCPWRTELQRNPLEKNPHFYTAETRAGMWFNWGPNGEGLADGQGMICHCGAYDEAAPGYVDSQGRPGQLLRDDGKFRYCAGGEALLHRALLRWVANGNHRKAPLRGARAGRWIVSGLLDVEPWKIDCSDWALPDETPWLIAGRRIMFRELVAAVHPAVFDPSIGSEQVPPLTEEECEQWNAVRGGDGVTLYHGGIAGLEVGDEILPRTLSGMPLDGQGAFDIDHSGYVHVTSDWRFASVFAAGAPGGGCGDIYQVEVDGPLEPDPDHPDADCSYLARSATVGRVFKRGCAVPHRDYCSDFWTPIYMSLRERRPALLAVVLARSTSKRSVVHGVDHWKRVAANGRELAAETPGADPSVVEAFAFIHDAMRESDTDDPQHGERGALLARQLHAERVLALSEPQLELLVRACHDHAAGATSSDPSIGVCWDADRLDLPRVGIQLRPEFLSTEAARGRLPALAESAAC